MTTEIFEKAQELVAKINGHKRTIKMLDTMLMNFDDPDRRITVCHQASKYGESLEIGSNELPELRDALKAAIVRYKSELRKTEDKLAAL